MADPKHDDGARLDLGDEEQWVLHAALLQYLGERTDEKTEPTADDGGFTESSAAEPTVDGDCTAALDLLDALESDDPLRLDREALLLVRELLSEYLAGAPLRDRATCRSVLAAVRDEL
ncbi:MULTISPECIES: DUF7853 family protein [Halolamina]|uniref:Uncharacterized protein n=1 Tax=Halolamina pelagica TaxID=699431 RepID=A0A1I5SAK8_9EURY|nr:MULTISPECIES: hypothetical protein [Halolamina]NHX37167.1 hypothetical protein [Halolamina sp. R1-12]SFP67306.1 hypothetical protein SAMN05216277_1067 [Halolamina pelagica]